MAQVSVALKMKLNSKKLLKHVLVGTSFKRWEKAVYRKNWRTSKDRSISVVTMEMIFDSDTGAIGRSVWFRCGDSHLACVILIEASVVSTVTQWVLRSVEGFPYEQSYWTWARRRRGFQDDRFDRRRAGWMNSNDDKQLSATVSPISGYETSLVDTIQCAALRPRMNILTHWPSWSWMTMATITDNILMSCSCAMLDSCNFQNLFVTSLFWNWWELIRYPSMIDCSPDTRMWFKRSFPELKTVAVLANSWKIDRPRLVVLHARRMVKGKFLVSIVDERCPFEKENTAQSK